MQSDRSCKLAGYADPGNYASRLMNVNEYPLVVAHYEDKQELYTASMNRDLPGQKATLGQLRDAAKRRVDLLMLSEHKKLL